MLMIVINSQQYPITRSAPPSTFSPTSPQTSDSPMASHDHTMLSPAEQVLRIINIVNLIPGLAFLIATGVTRRGRYWDGREIWAFVGIAPLTLSAILGLLVLLFRPRPGSLRALITAADSLLAGFALGIDSWGWARGRRPGVVSSLKHGKCQREEWLTR